MENQFGERIRQLREANHLFQRQIAGLLEIDTPMLSKMERGERRAKKEQVLRLAEIFRADKDDLLTLWLADQLYELVSKDEKVALRAIKITENSIKHNTTRTNTRNAAH